MTIKAGGNVSIHASARDATILVSGGGLSVCFNPRVRAGRDWSGKRCTPQRTSFNPRVRAGRDRRRPSFQTRHHGFNPRVRAGRDWSDDRRCGDLQVSIHASARDATPSISCTPRALLFQSTRPRGTRPGAGINPCPTSCFNPRVRAGRDRAVASVLMTVRFQSTRPRGTRRLGVQLCGVVALVSIHASARDATR